MAQGQLNQLSINKHQIRSLGNQGPVMGDSMFVTFCAAAWQEKLFRDSDFYFIFVLLYILLFLFVTIGIFNLIMVPCLHSLYRVYGIYRLSFNPQSLRCCEYFLRVSELLTKKGQ